MTDSFEPRLEQQLAASEERYRRLFDEDLTGRLVAAPDWRLVDVNAALSQMLGYEAPAQLVGRSLTEFAVDTTVLHKLVAIARAEGKAGPFEVSFTRLD